MIRHNAAFINALADEGNKNDIVEHLSLTWSQLMNLQIALIKLGYSNQQIEKMMETGKLG